MEIDQIQEISNKEGGGGAKRKTNQGRTPGQAKDWVKSAKCHYCHKVGHLKRNCFLRSKDRSNGIFRSNVETGAKAVNAVGEEGQILDEGDPEEESPHHDEIEGSSIYISSKFENVEAQFDATIDRRGGGQDPSQ